ncbi:MAG: hypothetical protein COV55_02900 [Candidatus Komeilibacteria bacterium CG11_big_fil_rev_8_21_14_0_20_36_20]|uniref:Uncharacterized protein n=1 Tax=Candidatus Komeilibacteria bacterium CG11_big_fil_rev_8_21_14_0_20_36_20 TaxID=1974477 RepID=A0A2H0NCQ7_9BACT|nr:MAG: hypothetical protein COV55_02900 [Candidatus Komeilibacteria bacterium CG11_big_fil_rev_8_21_14_0_20_36_20]
MSIIVIRRGLQGNRGLTGEAAPASITVANNIVNVNAVGDAIDDITTCADNLADIQAAPQAAIDAANNAAMATFFFGTTGGSANAYTLDTGGDIALANGQAFRFIANHLSTGNVTLTVDSNSAKPVRFEGLFELPEYTIKNGQVTTVIYDSVSDTFQPLESKPVTGDIIFYSKSSKPGYASLDGTTTIGSAASGATIAAAYCEGLYRLIWDNSDNAEFAVSSGRGGSAAADFAANKTLTLASVKDKSLHGVGTTLTKLGKTSGNANQSPTGSISINSFNIAVHNLPVHKHENVGSLGAGNKWGEGSTITAGNFSGSRTDQSAYSSPVGSGASITPTGSFSGSSMSILHPVFGMHVLIKI